MSQTVTPPSAVDASEIDTVAEHVPGTPIRNREFAIDGINHLALVCSDKERTIAFYTEVLGMPLVKDFALPYGYGRHFFFGLGNGDTLAFFQFEGAPAAAPGIAAPRTLPGGRGLLSAVGSMNHVAFTVPSELMDEYRDRLVAKGVDVTEIANHDTSPAQVSPDLHDGVFMRSMYFFDPDGILLEFACWCGEAEALASDQLVPPR